MIVNFYCGVLEHTLSNFFWTIPFLNLKFLFWDDGPSQTTHFLLVAWCAYCRICTNSWPGLESPSEMGLQICSLVAVSYINFLEFTISKECKFKHFWKVLHDKQVIHVIFEIMNSKFLVTEHSKERFIILFVCQNCIYSKINPMHGLVYTVPYSFYYHCECNS